MMASTARMLALPPSRRSGRTSLTAARCRDLRLRGQRGLREVEVEAASHAHLVVELEHLAAAWAPAPLLGRLGAIEDRREQPHDRGDRGDQEPDEERGALDASDDASGKA